MFDHFLFVLYTLIFRTVLGKHKGSPIMSTSHGTRLETWDEFVAMDTAASINRNEINLLVPDVDFNTGRRNSRLSVNGFHPKHPKR